jgi:hypothetical protein
MSLGMGLGISLNCLYNNLEFIDIILILLHQGYGISKLIDAKVLAKDR